MLHQKLQRHLRIDSGLQTSILAAHNHHRYHQHLNSSPQCACGNHDLHDNHHHDHAQDLIAHLRKPGHSRNQLLCDLSPPSQSFCRPHPESVVIMIISILTLQNVSSKVFNNSQSSTHMLFLPPSRQGIIFSLKRLMKICFFPPTFRPQDAHISIRM